MKNNKDRKDFKAFVTALKDMYSCGLEIGYIAVEESITIKKHPMTGIYHYDSIVRCSYYPTKKHKITSNIK